MAKKEEDKKALLNKTLKELNSKFGKDSIKMGNELVEAEKQPFGIPELDDMLGGGLPYGRFSTIWGPPGSSKTSLAEYLVASAQRDGKSVFYIALEPIDKERASKLGVDFESDSLHIADFPIAENSLDAIIKLSKEKVVDVIILDSIHSLSPKGENEDKKGDKSVEADTMALLARKLSQFFRMAVSPVAKGNVLVLLIGQTRTNIGFIAFEQLTTGNATKHYCKLILQVSRGAKADAPVEKVEVDELDKKGKPKKKKTIIGFDTRIKINKTQISGTKPELTELHLPYKFENGFNDLIPALNQVEEEKEETVVEEVVEKEEKPKTKRGRKKKVEVVEETEK